jgi:hypothetical protein
MILDTKGNPPVGSFTVFYFTVRFYFQNVFLESVCRVVRYENSLFCVLFAAAGDLLERKAEMDSVGAHAVESTRGAFPAYHAVSGALAFAVCAIQCATVQISLYQWKDFVRLYAIQEVLYCAAVHPV